MLCNQGYYQDINPLNSMNESHFACKGVIQKLSDMEFNPSLLIFKSSKIERTKLLNLILRLSASPHIDFWTALPS